jgi:2-polyprenyl-6-hydroxyphenyl methylase/3-demethylubiquinone-9 3-methyltransferase
MNKAFEHAASAVNHHGLLFIAIYNDEGRYSRMWLGIKKIYNRLPSDRLKKAMVISIAALLEMRLAAGRILSLKNPLPRWKERNAQSLRGMSVWHDYVDWIGGLPFEVAKSDEIFRFFRDRGFLLENMTTVGRGHGCNEFVFRRNKQSVELLKTGS